jgi:DNA primase
MKNSAEKVKRIATVPKALSLYGYDPHGRRRIPCPIHGGRNPNFGYSDHAWHCFKCGRGGDVISLVQELFGLSFRGALSKLAADFGIEAEQTEKSEYIRMLERFNERFAREEQAEREERRRELAERSKLHTVLYRQLLREPSNAELATYLNELEFELDFRTHWNR